MAKKNSLQRKNNGKINFVVMDAANDFEKFSNDLNGYECDIEF